LVEISFAFTDLVLSLLLFCKRISSMADGFPLLEMLSRLISEELIAAT